MNDKAPERTHWEGCWRDPKHHGCAVAEVERLERLAADRTQYEIGKKFGLLEGQMDERQRIRERLESLPPMFSLADAIKAVDDASV
jgi:hypothetical protein